MKSVPTIFIVMILAGCGGEPAPQKETAATQPPVAPQKAPDEPAALAAIAAVNAAQKTYLARYRRYALTYEELTDVLFLKEEPTVQKTGYDIKLRPAADAASYIVLGIPGAPSPAARHFFSDQTGTIRAEEGKDANAQSPQMR
jgi:hypothetical protein